MLLSLEGFRVVFSAGRFLLSSYSGLPRTRFQGKASSDFGKHPRCRNASASGKYHVQKGHKEPSGSITSTRTGRFEFPQAADPYHLYFPSQELVKTSAAQILLDVSQTSLAVSYHGVFQDGKDYSPLM